MATFERGETSWTDTKAVAGNTYNYYIELRLLAGGAVSNPSKVVSVKIR